MSGYIIGILAGIIGFLYFDRARLRAASAELKNQKALKDVEKDSILIEKNKNLIEEAEKKSENFKPEKKSADELVTYFNDDK